MAAQDIIVSDVESTQASSRVGNLDTEKMSFQN